MGVEKRQFPVVPQETCESCLKGSRRGELTKPLSQSTEVAAVHGCCGGRASQSTASLLSRRACSLTDEVSPPDEPTVTRSRSPGAETIRDSRSSARPRVLTRRCATSRNSNRHNDGGTSIPATPVHNLEPTAYEYSVGRVQAWPPPLAVCADDGVTGCLAAPRTMKLTRKPATGQPRRRQSQRQQPEQHIRILRQSVQPSVKGLVCD